MAFSMNLAIPPPPRLDIPPQAQLATRPLDGRKGGSVSNSRAGTRIGRLVQQLWKHVGFLSHVEVRRTVVVIRGWI